jgi:hypothetical protein
MPKTPKRKPLPLRRRIPLRRLEEVSGRNGGICLACNVESEACAPDAAGQLCSVCRQPQLHGPEAIMAAGLYA